MTIPPVTVVVTPNDRRSLSLEARRRIDVCTRISFDLVVVDGRTGRHHLSPNQARNAGLAHVRTEYVVFVGNDVLVEAGWLEALVGCADATGAAFVASAVRVGAGGEARVYFAGGETHVVTREDRRRLHDADDHAGRPWAEVRPGLRRSRSEAVTFHCVLVRTDVLTALDGLDEHLHAFEHVDLALRAHDAAGGGWFEPASVVTWVPLRAGGLRDLPWFLGRWRRARVESSAAHLCRVWDLDPAEPGLDRNLRWIEDHRRSVLGRASAWARRVGRDSRGRG